MSSIGLSPVLPSAFTVVFQVRRCAGSPADSFAAWHTETVTLAQAGFPDYTGSPGSQVLRSECLALYSTAGGPPSNQAALTALATQMATDYCAWRTRAFDRAYNGIIAPDMNGLIDEVEWRYDALPIVDGPAYLEDEDEPVVAGVTTRVRSAPFNGTPTLYHQQDPAVAACTETTTPCLEVYSYASGSSPMQWVVNNRCLEDGRLVDTYLRTDSLDCGCGCPTSTTKICFTVTDACTLVVIPGASVTLKDAGGNTVGTCTANLSGQCCIGVSKTGTYSAVVSASGYTSRNVTGLTVSACGTTVSRGVPLVAIGLTCCKGFPLPDSFTATDSLGSCTMSKTIIGTDTHYCGGYTASLSGTDGSCDGSGNCVPSTISTAVLYDLNCTTGELQVSVYTASCVLGPHGTFCWTFYPATVSSCTLTPAPSPTPSCSGLPTPCVIALGAFQNHTTGTYSPLNLTVDYSSPGLICNGNPDCPLNFPTTGTVTFTP